VVGIALNVYMYVQFKMRDMRSIFHLPLRTITKILYKDEKSASNDVLYNFKSFLTEQVSFISEYSAVYNVKWIYYLSKIRLAGRVGANRGGCW
jgi:hypothetical protein